MEIPYDQILIIFQLLPMVDKRNLYRTQKRFTNLPIKDAEDEFENSINEKKYFSNRLNRYTYEHIYSGYAKLIPERYLIRTNFILYRSSKIYYNSAKQGYLDNLTLLIRCNKTCRHWIMRGAAEGGHLEILKWGLENSCELDNVVLNKAAEYGHLEIIKWNL